MRDRLGIQPGNAVDFELAVDGRVVLVRSMGRGSGLRQCVGARALASAPTKSWRSRAVKAKADAGRSECTAGSSHQRSDVGGLVYPPAGNGVHQGPPRHSRCGLRRTVVRFKHIEALDAAVEEANLVLTATPRAALFLAGKALQRYRASGGTRTGALPDFFIRAHAAVVQMPLLTRDVKRYRTYFPTVEWIAPDRG